MAVSLFFGLPGCGKTTILSKLAYDAIRLGKYRHVWSNVELAIVGVTYIDNEVIGKYELMNGLLLIDEATLFADSRDFKNFSKARLEYFLKHRHHNVDIVLFTQQWDGVDRKIRTITDRVYYVYKPFLIGHWISTYVRVPYDILFPDPKKTGEKLGEIIQGYSKPPFFARLFAKRVYRPRYYKYFDSWELIPLEDLPSVYQPYDTDYTQIPIAARWVRDVGSFMFKNCRVIWRYRYAQAKILWRSRLSRVDSLLRTRKSARIRKKFHKNVGRGRITSGRGCPPA